MKYVKMLGLLVVAAAALMAFAGSASAEVATSPAGTVYTGTLSAESEGHAILHSPAGFTIECNSKTSGNITGHGSGHIPVSGTITQLEWPECTKGWTVDNLALGTLSVTVENGSAVVRGSGQKVTVENLSLGLHCIYATSSTVLGTLDSGTPARLTIAATIPRTEGRSGVFCGSSGTWTGTYKVTTPSTFIVDTT